MTDDFGMNQLGLYLQQIRVCTKNGFRTGDGFHKMMNCFTPWSSRSSTIDHPYRST